MKRWIPLLTLFLLAACGGDGSPRPVALSVTPLSMASPTAVAPSRTVPPVTSAATSTSTAAEPTPELVILTTPSSNTLPERPDSPVLPVLADEVILGSPVSVCAGDGLSFGEDGTVYTLGRRGDQLCASAIDLATGASEPVDPAALSLPSDGVLEVADPAGGRVYVAEKGVVVAFDDHGQEVGTVLVLPLGQPEQPSVYTGLHLDTAANRLYLGYQDFDGQAWIALADLSTGETIADVPVPSGPWALATDRSGIRDAKDDSRLLFSDADTLVVLDGSTLDLVNRLSLSRRPAAAVADAVGARLFVADAGGDLHVMDLATLAELDRLPGVGSTVDLDPKLGRLYVGDRYSGGVHVFDLVTLDLLERIPQPGQPVASPADGRIYILEEDIYLADGTTLELIAERTVRNSGCVGCIFPNNVIVDPIKGLVYTTNLSILTGQPGPASHVTVDPLTGRAFVARTTGGYQAVYGLGLYANLTLEEPIRWIDGLYGQLLYNPSSEQLYLARNHRLLVLDGQTLELRGWVNVGEAVRLLTVDGSNGWLYAGQGERLLRFEMGHASEQVSEPESVGQLPGPIYGISVSPGFAEDATLFVQAIDTGTGRSELYRSRDGGESWVRLEGGLPGAPNDLVFAPGGRLYAAVSDVGWRTAPEAATWGEGVYVSEDSGDTWRPENPGLTHLRVGRLHVDDNGVLYALTAAAVEPGGAASGPSVWTRLPDREWIPLPVPDAGPLRLVDYAIPTAYTVAVRAYWHVLSGDGTLYQSWGKELRRSDDGGRTWLSVGRGPTDYAVDVVGGSEGVYWLSAEALWRSADTGATWAALRHPDLDDGPPFLVVVADVGGAETLFLGTEAGRVIILTVAEATWEEPDR